MNSALLLRLPETLRGEFTSAQQLEALGRPNPGTDLTSARALGVEALDRALPDGGLPRGQVTELAVSAHAGLGTSIGLWACRAAQTDSSWEGSVPWCAFLDPAGTLYAPGVIAAGVQLERLLVLRPGVESLQRVALKLAESRVFSVIVIDTLSSRFSPQPVALSKSQTGTVQAGKPHAEKLQSWERAVRRLAIAIQGTGVQVVLMTDLAAPRPMALPVALRLEVNHESLGRLSVRVTKDKRGRAGYERWVPVAQPLETPITNLAYPGASSSAAARKPGAGLSTLAGTIKRASTPPAQRSIA
jgi:recA bacterial DNA recombination protein